MPPMAGNLLRISPRTRAASGIGRSAAAGGRGPRWRGGGRRRAAGGGAPERWRDRSRRAGERVISSELPGSTVSGSPGLTSLPSIRSVCRSGSIPTAGSSTVSSSISAGISISGPPGQQADREARAVAPGLEAGCRDLAQRAPAGRCDAVDLFDRLEQGVGPAERVLVVAVEDQRLVEEGAQGQLGASSGRRSGGAGGPATPSTNSAGPQPTRAPASSGRASQEWRLELDPGVGPGHRDRLEAAAAQAAQGRLRAGLVGRHHDPVDGDAGAAAEGLDPAQGLGGQRDRVGLGRRSGPARRRSGRCRGRAGRSRRRSPAAPAGRRGWANQASSGTVARATW